jgi:hypothetical protein
LDKAIPRKAAFQRVGAAQIDLEEAQRRIAQERALICDLKRSKVLYAGTGANLVEETASALREFGLTVVQGPHPRADLLIWDGTRLAAAEVKGLEGVPKEVDVRQVIAWVADVNRTLTEDLEGRNKDPVLAQYAENLTELGLDMSAPSPELECQGLMIIATHRKTPLDSRTAASFPDPVEKIIRRFDVAALTGLDLYCFLQELRSNPDRKEKITEKLVTFRGVMPPRNWRQFITSV